VERQRTAVSTTEETVVFVLTVVISSSEFFGHEWRWGISETPASFGAFCEHGAVLFRDFQHLSPHARFGE
jgi:hypothetical protein